MNDTPVFVLEDVSFMGLPPDAGSERAEKYAGETKLDCSFRPLYVHGKLERHVGYDIAKFASGHIKAVDRQDVVLVDSVDEKHDCMLVSVVLPHVKEPTRAAFIVYEEEADRVSEYLAKKVAETTKEWPRPLL
jgi:hypothetical protein